MNSYLLLMFTPWVITYHSTLGIQQVQDMIFLFFIFLWSEKQSSVSWNTTHCSIFPRHLHCRAQFSSRWTIRWDSASDWERYQVSPSYRTLKWTEAGRQDLLCFSPIKVIIFGHALSHQEMNSSKNVEIEKSEPPDWRSLGYILHFVPCGVSGDAI